MNLLILDDEIYFLTALKEKVPWHEHGISEVLTAETAAKARQLLLDTTVDVAICDIEMPDESGLEFAKWLLHNEPTTQVIFLTGHARFEYAQQAVRLDAFDYIVKPVPFAQILESVIRACEQVEAIQQQNKDARRWERYETELQIQRPEQIRQFWRDVIDNRVSRKRIWSQIAGFDISLSEDEQILPIAIWIRDDQRFQLADPEDLAGFALRKQIDSFLGTSGLSLAYEGMDALVLIYQSNVSAELLCRELKNIAIQLGCIVESRVGDLSSPEELWWTVQELVNQLVRPSANIPALSQIQWERMLYHRDVDLLHEQVAVVRELLERDGCTPDLLIAYHELSAAVWSLSVQNHLSERTSSLLTSYNAQQDNCGRLVQWMYSLINSCVADLETGFGSQSTAVYNACLFIDKNLGNELSREIVAQQIHMHPVYFARLFKDEMGMSIGDYVARKRVDLSRQLLMNDGLKIQAIAKQCGFTNVSYFNRVFRKHTGMTPIEYRENALA
ncbi:MAG: helix-turn-helix domain-containing protein [Bacillota bacterium]|nr:helix-turn-helix domain-containing protein [Bacillota bacterium]